MKGDLQDHWGSLDHKAFQVRGALQGSQDLKVGLENLDNRGHRAHPAQEVSVVLQVN